MRFCQYCGKEIMDETVICPSCGCSVAQDNKQKNGGDDVLAVVSKVFLILACIVKGFLLIPLMWCLPITVSICRKLKYGQPIGTGLKVCTLLFVDLVAGILLLCRPDDK